MEPIKSTLNSQQYSNSISKEINTSNSTVQIKEVFRNLTDLIPEDDYKPFYVSRYKKLGYKRFMELANKARAGRAPQRLFFWMLKNNEVVK